MIGYLKGKIKFVSEAFVLVDCNGVGYRVEIGGKLLDEKMGETVEFFTYTHVRENELRLFGFEKLEDLSLFEMLLEVNGVGPKVALSLITQLGAKKVVNSVLMKDGSGLKVSGVGIKTADKIVLELYDKLKKKGFRVTSGGKSPMRDKHFIKKLQEAEAALKSLGYSSGDVKKVIESSKFRKDSTKMSSGELVKYLLSKM